MKEARKKDTDPARHGAMHKGQTDRGAGGAMSASMRQLILSFGETDSERTWDPDAYTRRPNQWN